MESENTYCIYRERYKNIKCKNKCINDNKYCKKHMKYKSVPLFNIVDEACNGVENILNINETYNIFKYIYEKYVTDIEELKKKLFIKIIGYLFYSNDIYKLLNKNNLKIKKKNSKTNIIYKLYLLFYNTYNLPNDNHNNISKIQRFFKKNIIKNINKKYDINNISHKKDPFTLDDISDIPIKHRFYFQDNNNIYCFNVIEFEYYLRNNRLNPYTKNIIDNSIIERIKLFIYYNNIELKTDNLWNTPEQAYTDVVYYMEKIGFYNNILWFNELTYNNIINIIQIYQDLKKNVNITNNCFDENILIEINNENYPYIFSKEIISLFKNGNDHFLLCCNFIKSLGIISNNFYNNIPEWLSNINSISGASLNNNYFAIYFNNNFEPIDNINVNEDIPISIDPSTIYYLLEMLNRNN